MTASSLAFTALGVVLLATAWAAPTKSGNMNGKYVVASVDKLHVPWNDDYASKGHEYFDVWAPEYAISPIHASRPISVLTNDSQDCDPLR